MMIFQTVVLLLVLSFISMDSIAVQELSEYQKLEKKYHEDMKARDIERIALAVKYDIAHIEYITSQMDHNITIFKWQRYYGIGIFFLVIILVLSGTYLSYLQFRKDGAKVPSETKIEAGANGVSVNSPVIGLIILFMSFAFFYLYIMEVYTIKPPHNLESQPTKEKNTTNQSEGSSSSAAN